MHRYRRDGVSAVCPERGMRAAPSTARAAEFRLRLQLRLRSANESTFLIALEKICLNTLHQLLAAPYRACIRSAHVLEPDIAHKQFAGRLHFNADQAAFVKLRFVVVDENRHDMAVQEMRHLIADRD